MKSLLVVLFAICAASLLAQPIVWDNMDACSGNWKQSTLNGTKKSFRPAQFDTTSFRSPEGGCYLSYATADTFRKGSFVGWFAQQKLQVWNKRWVNMYIYSQDAGVNFTMDIADDADGDSTTLTDVDTMRSIVKTLTGGWQEVNFDLLHDFTDINPAVGNNLRDSIIRSLTFRFTTNATYASNDTIRIRLDQVQNSDTTGFAYLAYSPDTLAPGVLFGSSQNMSVVLMNSGSAWTPIKNVTLSGPGVARYIILHKPDSLFPGKKDSIVVNYAPTVIGADTAVLTFQSNAVDNPGVTIPIYGFSDSASATSDKWLIFDLASCAVGSSISDGAVIRNTGRVPLIMLNYDSVNGPGETEYKRIANFHGIITPGNIDSMMIQFTPIFTGSRYATLKLFYRKTQTRIDSLYIPMLGVGGYASINNTPLNVVDSMTLGDTLVFPIELENYGSYGVRMQRQVILGPDAASFRLKDTLKFPLFPSIPDSVTIVCKPTSLGNKFAYLELVTDAQNEPVVVVPFSIVVGTRVLTASPTIVFQTDTALVGSSISRSVLVQSTGTLSVRIDSVRLLRRDTTGSFVITRQPKSQFGVGDNDTLTIDFSPLTQGIKIDTIRIYTNSPSVPYTDIALHGFAGARRIFASDTTVVDTITINKSLTKCITVRDSGNLPITIKNIILGGTNADQYTLLKPTTFPVTINPGTADTICVKVTPTSEGDKLAQLLIQTDAQNIANLYINLKTYGTTVRVIDPWEQPFTSLISAAPNPFRTATALHVEIAAGEQLIHLGVFDLLGREVQDLTKNSNSDPIALQMENYPAGMYYVRMTTTERFSVLPLVIAR